MDVQTKRELQDLRGGRIETAGSFDLAVAPATSTVITRNNISSTSVILSQAYSALASNADITRIVPGNGTFTVYHSSSASARTHRYVAFTGL